MPTYEQVEEAMRRALPGFAITFSVDALGGNPRDGYLHGVTLRAVKEGIDVRAELGGFLSATPNRDDASVFLLHEFAPRITSTAPWLEQRAVWESVAAAFFPMGYRDATISDHAICQQLIAFLHQRGEDEEASRLTLGIA